MKPLILITNDDGIYSPGLHAAAEAVADLGELLIVAPHCQQTSMGRAFPRTDDLGIIETTFLMIHGKRTKAYAVHGSPAYAVAHAVLELAERKPNLCISGINYGENLGTIVTCSGTLGAAFEANSHDIPAIASSLQMPLHLQRKTNYSSADWRAAAEMTRRAAESVLSNGMPNGTTLLNINVPDQLQNVQNYHITRQSHQNYFCFVRPEQRDFSKKFELESRLYVDTETLEPDSDIYAIYVEKVISVTPMTWNMTADSNCLEKRA